MMTPVDASAPMTGAVKNALPPPITGGEAVVWGGRGTTVVAEVPAVLVGGGQSSRGEELFTQRGCPSLLPVSGAFEDLSVEENKSNKILVKS